MLDHDATSPLNSNPDLHKTVSSEPSKESKESNTDLPESATSNPSQSATSFMSHSSFHLDSPPNAPVHHIGAKPPVPAPGPNFVDKSLETAVIIDDEHHSHHSNHHFNHSRPSSSRSTEHFEVHDDRQSKRKTVSFSEKLESNMESNVRTNTGTDPPALDLDTTKLDQSIGSMMSMQSMHSQPSVSERRLSAKVCDLGLIEHIKNILDELPQNVSKKEALRKVQERSDVSDSIIHTMHHFEPIWADHLRQMGVAMDMGNPRRLQKPDPRTLTDNELIEEVQDILKNINFDLSSDQKKQYLYSQLNATGTHYKEKQKRIDDIVQIINRRRVTFIE